MKVFVPRESDPVETRVALIPETVARLVQQGMEVTVESDAGARAFHDDGAYRVAGAVLTSDRPSALASADLVLRVRKPPLEEVSMLQEGAIHVSFLDPFNERELVETFARARVTAISMEMIPRTTLAQKMDALSSQASLAGYVAVLLAAERLGKVLPMMMTPAGTLKPSRIFVIGAGVAGLQAIATARRLGAQVEAFDTRPVVEEQVKSLGARFVKIDLGETGQTKDGYARALTEEQQQRQREGMARVCAQSDAVITTAQLFGRRAPVLLTTEMLASMRPGSVVVDLAVESGGNVEGVELGQETLHNGVRVIGLPNLPGRVPVHASQMYSSNLYNLISSYQDPESGHFTVDLDEEILQGCVITCNGRIVNEQIREAYSIEGSV